MPNNLGIRTLHIVFLSLLLLSSCHTTRQKSLKTLEKSLVDFLHHPTLSSAHCGILVREIGQSQNLLDYQSKKLFIPASNVKILTSYCALQHYSDSTFAADIYVENERTICIDPGLDPTFLHGDFSNHTLLEKMKSFDTIKILKSKEWPIYPPGWSWEDYDRYFMPQISTFPMYGNVTTILKMNNEYIVSPRFFANCIDTTFHVSARHFSKNKFYPNQIKEDSIISIPFISDTFTIISLLKDTLKDKHITWTKNCTGSLLQTLKGQSIDSVLSLMMARSDNFYAEQLLLSIMKSKGALGSKFDILLPSTTDEPLKWIDGSGLSRYNLMSPTFLVYILEQIFQNYEEKRIWNIFPSGQDDALKDAFEFFGETLQAKTGSMGNIFCLSGYLQGRHGKKYVFSIVVNGHTSKKSMVKNEVAKLLKAIQMN
ncbi:MAG: D-alanyl-D-alanine carboxypeptidase [Saprospiraceae bacterium]